jgi:hypothetical protein
MVAGELRRLVSTGNLTWHLSYWRDRSKEADFLLHRAGRFLLADAKWSEHPGDAGKLPLVRGEFRPAPPAAVICRCANR